MKKKCYYVVTANGIKLWFDNEKLASAFAETDRRSTTIVRDAALVPPSRRAVADQQCRHDKNIAMWEIMDYRKANGVAVAV